MPAIPFMAGALALAAASHLEPKVANEELALSALPAETPTAPAAPAAVQDDWTITWKWKDGLRFESVNGQVKGKFGGLFQFDTSFLSLDDSLEDAGFDDSDGTEFRRARLWVDLELWNGFFARAMYDFVASTTAIKDLYIGKKDVIGDSDLQIGHFKEPLSIGQLTSDSYTTFIERAMVDLYAPSRNNGIMLSDSFAGDAVNWAIGGFKDTNDGGINVQDGGFAVTGRVSGSPVYNEDGSTVVHLGVGYTQRDVSELQQRTRPEVHIAPFLLDSGVLPTEDLGIGNLELAGVFGPIHATTEYFTSSASGADGSPDFDSDGFYVEAGYFITGETRPYRRAGGVFDRLVPLENFTDGGPGAIEVAARFSTLDLTDGAVVGGEEDNITVALNWYLTPSLRAGVNYITGTVDLGAGLDSEDVSALLTRIELNW
jgi:phosphate-selective porin OprO and OprP